MAMPQRMAYLAAVFAIVVWSVTFTNIRALLADFSSLEMLIVRFAMTWAVLWAWSALQRQEYAILHAMENQMLFALLAVALCAALSASAALAVPDEVAKATNAFSIDPEVLYRWRDNLADLIEAL